MKEVYIYFVTITMTQVVKFKACIEVLIDISSVVIINYFNFLGESKYH